MRIATNIEWEVDDEDILETLPQEIEIPDEVEDEDIEDYLTNETGYLVNGYSVAESKFLS